MAFSAEELTLLVQFAYEHRMLLRFPRDDEAELLYDVGAPHLEEVAVEEVSVLAQEFPGHRVRLSNSQPGLTVTPCRREDDHDRRR